MKKRLDWIDIGKGLGIILMYYGHIGCPLFILRLIYAFHMPLFFFLSGYVLKTDMTFYDFFKKKCLRLLKPFFIFGCATIFINYALSIFTHNYYDVLNSLYYMFLQQIGTPARLWFIPCIFMCEIICYAFLVYNKKILYTIFFIFSWINVYFFHFKIPWYVDIAVISSLFMIFGYMLRITKFEVILNKKQLCIIVFLFCCFVYLNSFYGFVDIANNQYGNPFLFYINAILGIIIVVNIANRINFEVIKYIGRNSLFFMFLNSISIKASSIVVNKIFSILNYVDNQICNLFILVISLIFVYITSKILKNIFPKLMTYIGLL